MEKVNFKNQLLVHLSTVAVSKCSYRSWVNIQSAGWVNIQSARTAMDIIKNKMLAQMERKHDVDIDESFERWQKLIEAIPDTNDQERFLRHFYNAFKHLKEIKVDKVTRATRSLIIRIYASLINRDAAKLFDAL